MCHHLYPLGRSTWRRTQPPQRHHRRFRARSPAPLHRRPIAALSARVIALSLDIDVDAPGRARRGVDDGGVGELLALARGGYDAGGALDHAGDGCGVVDAGAVEVLKGVRGGRLSGHVLGGGILGEGVR